MLWKKLFTLLSVLALWATLAQAAPTASRKHAKPSVKRVSQTTHSSRARRLFKRKSARARGQQSIQDDRALDIQQALIREKYMSGEPSGKWDQATKDAMARYQSDNGWQTKMLPDSRALIKLGLGPSHQDILNPETAAITLPAASSAVGGGGPIAAAPNHQ
jgi:peptidoglycan hydrolase-like protein with peptidoglycan-binding domain